MRLKVCLLILASWCGSLVAHASDLSDKLSSANHVLLMRHTLAPGVGDPANYTLQDCKSQRNLSSEGRAQARAVGVWLKKQGITQAQIFSSPWCRCKDTAILLDLGPVRIEPALASFFDEMHKAKKSNQALAHFISKQLQTKGERPLILVTHHVNIFEFMGENIASGDLVLAQVDGAGRMVSYTHIPRPTN